MKKSVKIAIVSGAVALVVAAAILIPTVILPLSNPSNTGSDESPDESILKLLEKSDDPNTYVYEYCRSEHSNGTYGEEKYSYDSSGNLLSKEIKYSYSDDVEKEVYEYDKNGNLILKEVYENEILQEKDIYEYNERGDMTLNTSVTYDLRSGEYKYTRFFHFEYEYNADGYITKITQSNDVKDTYRNVEKIISEIEYSSENRPVSVTEEIIHCEEYLEKRPNLERSSKYTVFYNDKLQKDKTVIYNDDGSSRVSQDSEVDENGNLIIRFYDEDGNIEQLEITKYYSNGLVKSNNRYDSDNEKLAERSYKYNQYGDCIEEYENFIYAKESNLYRYDDYGNTIYSKSTYRDSEYPNEREYNNELDENGNILTSSVTLNGNVSYTKVYTGWKAFVYAENEKESPVNKNSSSILDGLITSYLL